MRAYTGMMVGLWVLGAANAALASAPSCPESPSGTWALPSVSGVAMAAQHVRVTCRGDASDATCALAWRGEVDGDPTEARVSLPAGWRGQAPDAGSLRAGARLEPARGLRRAMIVGFPDETRHLVFGPDFDEEHRRIVLARPEHGVLHAHVTVPDSWRIVGRGHEEPYCDRHGPAANIAREQRDGVHEVTFRLSAGSGEETDGLGDYGSAPPRSAGVTFELPRPAPRILGPVAGLLLRPRDGGALAPSGVHLGLDVGIGHLLWLEGALEWDDGSFVAVPSVQAGFPGVLPLFFVSPYASVGVPVRVHPEPDLALRLAIGAAVGPVVVAGLADLWIGLGGAEARVDPGMQVLLSL